MGESKRHERVLGLGLSVGVLDCVYLSWRYLAVHIGWDELGTGLCSWSQGVDCDKVLLTPEANAFFVPNALLGLGFFGGVALWWFIGRRILGARLRRALLAMVIFWLSLATLFTFYFFYLLVQLPALCPFCPWNHVFTYVALAGALSLWRSGWARTDDAAASPWFDFKDRRYIALVLACVSWFVACQAVWLLYFSALHIR